MKRKFLLLATMYICAKIVPAYGELLSSAAFIENASYYTSVLFTVAEERPPKNKRLFFRTTMALRGLPLELRDVPMTTSPVISRVGQRYLLIEGVLPELNSTTDSHYRSVSYLIPIEGKMVVFSAKDKITLNVVIEVINPRMLKHLLKFNPCASTPTGDCSHSHF